jgi:hypothetical protein
MQIQCPDCQKNFTEYDAHGVCIEIYNQCLICRIKKVTPEEMKEIHRTLDGKLKGNKTS